MAILFDETDDYFSIADHASLSIPDGDWCVGIWTYVSDNAGTESQWLVSCGNWDAIPDLNIALGEVGNIWGNADKWFAQIRDDGSDNVKLQSATSPGADSTWRLIILQRVSAVSEIQLWFCEPGQTATKEDSGWDASLGSMDGGIWYIGARTGLTQDFYGSVAGEFFKGDFSLSQSEIEALGAGRPIYALGHEPDVYLPMHTSVAVLEDIFGPNDATRASAPTSVEHAPVGGVTGPLFVQFNIAAGALFFQACAGVLTFVGAIQRQTNKQLAGAMTPAGALQKQTNKQLAGAITPAGALQRQTNKPLAGVLTFAGTLQRQINKILAGGLTFIGALNRMRAITLAGTLTFVGGLQRQTNKQLAGTLTFMGAIQKVISKTLAGTLTFIGNLTAGLAGIIGILLEAKQRVFALQGMTRDLVLETCRRLFGLDAEDR